MTTTKELGVLTRVLLRGHRSAHDVTEVLQPILLVALRLAGEQEGAVGRYYGDAVLPGTVAVGAGGQAGGGAVAVVFVPQEHLALGKGVLQDGEAGMKERRVRVEPRLFCSIVLSRFV